MIEFPRALARQLWAVWRRAVPKPHGPRFPLAEFQAGPKGLNVRVAHPEVAVEYRQPGSFRAETVTVPLTALGAFESKGKDTVTLETGDDGKVIARWQDAGVPQIVEYEATDTNRQAEFPDEPERFIRNPPGLLQTLEEAGHSTAGDAVRYALNRLLLRGRSGEVAATNGKELLIQGGFHFPWEGDVLVPRVSAWTCRELGQPTHVEVGKAEQHVVLRIGSWTAWLHVDADARFPKVEQVIPRLGDKTTHWRIAPEDAAFLSRTLPHLPGQNDDQQPLTVDLNGQVCVRARAEGQGRATEVVLARSGYTGPVARFCLNRQGLARLLKLGFEEVHVISPDTPILSQDNQRTFVVMPLDKKGAIAPSEDMLRVASADTAERPTRSTTTERKKPSMPATSPNGNGHGAVPRQADPPTENGKISFGSLLAEAQALKDLLRDAYGRSNHLVAALKRHRQQSKLLSSTIGALRQLQGLGS